MLPVRYGVDLSDTLLCAPRGKRVTKKNGVAVGQEFAWLADVLHKLLEGEQSIGFASEWNNVGVTRVTMYEQKSIFAAMYVGDGAEGCRGVLHKVGRNLAERSIGLGTSGFVFVGTGKERPGCVRHWAYMREPTIER